MVAFSNARITYIAIARALIVFVQVAVEFCPAPVTTRFALPYDPLLEEAFLAPDLVGNDCLQRRRFIQLALLYKIAVSLALLAGVMLGIPSSRPSPL